MVKTQQERGYMNMKAYLNKLEWDTSVDELEQLLTGEKELSSCLTVAEKREIKTNVIPQLIVKMRKENDEFARELVQSPIMRLAYHHCYHRGIPKANVFDVAKEIIDRVNKDDTDKAVSQRLSEYCKRTRNA